ncbi:hypothetical protein NL676_012495 [Syzygium grande]|nr:hypothetical protein NL676_012495 [Syzygium grande]
MYISSVDDSRTRRRDLRRSWIIAEFLVEMQGICGVIARARRLLLKCSHEQAIQERQASRLSPKTSQRLEYSLKWS